MKAAAGGGGKGFRVALTEKDLKEAYEGASREGEKFFSDGTVYLERYLPKPRHVEVQIIADKHGNCIHLGERDCSIQRRHQKLIEEAPAPSWVVDEELRAKIGEIGINAAKAVNYVGAGTIEGMLQDGEYFFLEMNTRVQVEHCVTEMVTGIDIVKQGIKAAAGLPLDYTQDDVVLRGHAIECRINAEDASRNFVPTPGAIGEYLEPTGPAFASIQAWAPWRRLPDVRPDGLQAHRLGCRSRAGHRPHAARALGVQDRGPDHPPAVPLDDHGHQKLGRGVDVLGAA